MITCIYPHIRKHIKIESERWYYWTDRLGLLVWQDFPSISDVYNPSGVPQEDRQNFALQYRRWMEQRGNHPSIILWVVFNEAWGQARFYLIHLEPCEISLSNCKYSGDPIEI